ncbi:MAG TPA: hypothetical protein VMH20_01750 [Verrucomicrobiae bacterium]|nr:hypothetical protein [Verrucomicrobiae bacterium]
MLLWLRLSRSYFLCLLVAAAVMSVPLRAQDEHLITFRGQVLNSVTKEPVPHALVTLMGQQYAMFTDDQGRYEFQIHAGGKMGLVVARGSPSGSVFINRLVTARKPGYLDSQRTARSATRPRSTRETSSDMTIYLVPEALLVGHVDVPGSEGEVRIDCELYRREMHGGRQVWSTSGSSTTWGNGECRFSDLSEGTYKLITREQMDRDSLAQVPGGPLFGYPPVYYPNTTDFSAAGDIAVKAGQTAQVNVTVARHAYFPVRLGTRNAPLGLPVTLTVWPMGHWGPGWSLGYNPAEQTIEGMLPSGNYTVEAYSRGEPGATGIANFSVKGAPVEGPGLIFVPNPSITVTVRQEFYANRGTSDNGDASNPRVAARRAGNIHIALSALDESGAPQDVQAQPVEGSQGREYTIPSVCPGRYRVDVSVASGGYTAAIESGGKDLMNQPLVVPLGGAVPPIEITTRDDGAEVDGTVTDSSSDGASVSGMQTVSQHFIYLVPANGAQGQMTVVAENGNFSFTQIPPGDYFLVAFAEQQEDLGNGSGPLPPELQDKAQAVHLEEGQKVNVTLHQVDGGAE